MNNDEIYGRLIAQAGTVKYLLRAIESMALLSAGITRIIAGRADFKLIARSMVDVEISMGQVTYMLRGWLPGYSEYRAKLKAERLAELKEQAGET